MLTRCVVLCLIHKSLGDCLKYNKRKHKWIMERAERQRFFLASANQRSLLANICHFCTGFAFQEPFFSPNCVITGVSGLWPSLSTPSWGAFTLHLYNRVVSSTITNFKHERQPFQTENYALAGEFLIWYWSQWSTSFSGEGCPTKGKMEDLQWRSDLLII